MRHLDLEAKSSLYRQFTETLNGVITIRAFGWKPAFLGENHKLPDFPPKQYYLLFCIQLWLAVVMDLFVAGIAIVLVRIKSSCSEADEPWRFSYLGISGSSNVGFTGCLCRRIHSPYNS